MVLPPAAEREPSDSVSPETDAQKPQSQQSQDALNRIPGGGRGTGTKGELSAGVFPEVPQLCWPVRGRGRRENLVAGPWTSAGS